MGCNEVARGRIRHIRAWARLCFRNRPCCCRYRFTREARSMLFHPFGVYEHSTDRQANQKRCQHTHFWRQDGIAKRAALHSGPWCFKFLSCVSPLGGRLALARQQFQRPATFLHVLCHRLHNSNDLVAIFRHLDCKNPFVIYVSRDCWLIVILRAYIAQALFARSIFARSRGSVSIFQNDREAINKPLTY